MLGIAIHPSCRRQTGKAVLGERLPELGMNDVGGMGKDDIEEVTRTVEMRYGGVVIVMGWE